MGKTFVRGKEKYSLAEKKELGEVVEKYKKEYDKEVKAIFHFSMQKMSTRSNLAERYPINHFPTSPGYANPPPPPLAYYILHKFPPPLLIRTPRLFGTLEYMHSL